LKVNTDLTNNALSPYCGFVKALKYNLEMCWFTK